MSIVMNLNNKIVVLLTVEEKGCPVKAIKFYLKATPAKFDACSTTCSQKVNGNTYKLTLMTEKPNLVKEEPIKKLPSVFINSPVEKEISSKNLSDFLKFIVPEKKVKKEIQEHIECFVKKTCVDF